MKGGKMELFRHISKTGKINSSNVQRKAFFQAKLTVNQPNDAYEQEADHMADKVMRLGDNAVNQNAFFKPAARSLQRKCQACEEEDKHVHRKESSGGELQPDTNLDNYIGSLSSSGQPLAEASRRFFEPRFGHDFSKVRLHTDAVAAKSAQSINALAYTSGPHIVFNQNQYAPQSEAGQRLMAHELTHVVQQSGGTPAIQRITCPAGAAAPPTVAAGVRNAIDATAQNIITRAADATVAIGTRATRAVSDIVCAYYPNDAGKIRNLTYTSSEPGLSTTSVGSGTATQGDIQVGDYFVNNITATSISRRIFQTGHELDHIGQYRTGLAGGQHQDEREFLAFYHNGVADDFQGTGHMAAGMRKTIIDQALGYYNCLDHPLQQQHQSKQQELLTKRQTVNGTGGHAATTASTACVRQP